MKAAPNKFVVLIAITNLLLEMEEKANVQPTNTNTELQSVPSNLVPRPCSQKSIADPNPTIRSIA